jgi:hypothetical protein
MGPDKGPEEPSKDDQIAELKEKLRICEAARDAARADRDQSDAQLRAIVRSMTEGQLLRLSQERLARLDSKRAQAPRHLAPPPQPPIVQDLAGAMQQMERFICNCAPGRHELFVRPTPIDVNRDYEALFGKTKT